MSLQKWVEYGWLRREPTSPGEIKDLLGIVDRSLADSKVEAVSTDLSIYRCFQRRALRRDDRAPRLRSAHYYPSRSPRQNNRISGTHHKGQSEGHSKIQDLQQQEEQIGLRRCRRRIRSGVGSDGETRRGTEEQHPSLAPKLPCGAIESLEPEVLGQRGKSSAIPLELSVGLSGGFGPLQAFGESGIERLGILMSDGGNIRVAEAVPALHILNGRWKRPSRHERIVEAH